MDFNFVSLPLNTSYAMRFTGNDVMHDENGLGYVKSPPSYDMHQRKHSNLIMTSPENDQLYGTPQNNNSDFHLLSDESPYHETPRDHLSDSLLVIDFSGHNRDGGLDLSLLPVDYTCRERKSNGNAERRTKAENGKASKPTTTNNIVIGHQVTSWGKPPNSKHVETILFDGQRLLQRCHQPEVVTKDNRQPSDDVIDLSCDRTTESYPCNGERSVHARLPGSASLDDVLRTLQQDYDRKERLIESKRLLLSMKERELSDLERILDEKIATVAPQPFQNIVDTPFSRDPIRDLVHRTTAINTTLETANDNGKQPLDYRTISGCEVIKPQSVAFEPLGRSGIDNASSVSASGQAGTHLLPTGSSNRFVTRSDEANVGANTVTAMTSAYHRAKPAQHGYAPTPRMTTSSTGEAESIRVVGRIPEVPLSSTYRTDGRFIHRDTTVIIPREQYYELPRKRGRPKGSKHSRKSHPSAEKMLAIQNAQMMQQPINALTDERELFCRPIRTAESDAVSTKVHWTNSNSSSTQPRYMRHSPYDSECQPFDVHRERILLRR